MEMYNYLHEAWRSLDGLPLSSELREYLPQTPLVQNMFALACVTFPTYAAAAYAVLGAILDATGDPDMEGP